MQFSNDSWKHHDTLWDSVRLPLMDMYADGLITTQQLRQTAVIFREAWKQQALTDKNAHRVQVEEFKLERVGRKLSVYVRLTCEGYAGTMAELLCKTAGHFFVGPGGHITAVRSLAGTKKRDLNLHPLIYGWSH
jgi:hypothetical protein